MCSCCSQSLSRVWLFVTPRTAARQAPLPMGTLQARILEWVATPSSRVSSQPRSPALQADSLPSEPPGKPECIVSTLKSCHYSVMDRPWGYYANWSKSDRERQIPYDLTYMWNHKAKQITNPELIYTANRLVGARDKESGWKKMGEGGQKV